jgi:hypothetical protein
MSGCPLSFVSIKGVRLRLGAAKRGTILKSELSRSLPYFFASLKIATPLRYWHVDGARGERF